MKKSFKQQMQDYVVRREGKKFQLSKAQTNEAIKCVMEFIGWRLLLDDAAHEIRVLPEVDQWARSAWKKANK